MAEVISMAERRQQKAKAATSQAEAERLHAEQQAAARAAAAAGNVHLSGSDEQKRMYALRQRSARQVADLILGPGFCIKSELTVVNEETVQFTIGDAEVTREVTIQIKEAK